MDSWKASFLRAGVYPERESSDDKSLVSSIIDDVLRQTRDEIGCGNVSNSKVLDAILC